MKTEIILLTTSLLATASFAAGPRYSDWSEPVNLGPVINTASNDQHPAPLEGWPEPLLHVEPPRRVRRG
jgi:hypothetical protein